MGTPLSTLCFKLARLAEQASQPQLSYVLKMAATMALNARVEIPDTVASQVGSWDWDIASDRIFLNPYAAVRFGIEPTVAAKGVPLETAVQAIHRSDVGRVAAAIERSLRGGGLYAETYRTVVDGHVYVISANGGAVLDDGGSPIRCFGVLVDAMAAERAMPAQRRAVN